jgi:uncharacterized protein
MSDEIAAALAQRVAEYVRQESIRSILISFHGGEPLLAGVSRIVGTAHRIRDAVSPDTSIGFAIQTNGTLLDDKALSSLAEAGIGVSLSIDGGQTANDRHRLDHGGASSFDRTFKALKLLERHPGSYGGLLSVIDPTVPPEELFDFVGPRRPPAWDLLLPDAHHERRPPGRDADPGLYQRWLLRAFDIWFDRYSDIPLRFFDSVLAGCVGLPSETDAFGFGAPHVLTIETDGSYHNLDFLKITESGATSLGLNVFDDSIYDAAKSPKLLLHSALLRSDGVAEGCRRCSEVQVCGGGAVHHRYSRSGLRNPTVYCVEMLSLVRHARTRLNEAVASPNLKLFAC